MPLSPSFRRAFIALGSNLGDKIANCIEAARKISETEGVVCVTLSHPYETAPFQMVSDNVFINAVLEARTNLSPWDLLERLLEIEAGMGRDRTRGPDRTIDLDILFMEGIIIDGKRNGYDLVLPHPRMGQRAFVLMPWAELAPDLVVEPFGKTVMQMLQDLPSSFPVLRRLSWEAERILA